MALRAISALTPDPRSVERPVKIKLTFTVQLVDVMTPTLTDRSLELSLSPRNDLVFAGGGKTVTRTRKVGATAVEVTLNESISGTGDEAASFLVTLSESGGDELASCFVNLEE